MRGYFAHRLAQIVVNLAKELLQLLWPIPIQGAFSGSSAGSPRSHSSGSATCVQRGEWPTSPVAVRTCCVADHAVARSEWRPDHPFTCDGSRGRRTLSASLD